MMHFKVVFRAAKALQSAGLAVLRFNFRGVGRSEGVHDHGAGEQEDARAALVEMQGRFPGLPLVLGGFSFGSAVAPARRRARRRGSAPSSPSAIPLSRPGDAAPLESVRPPRLFVQGENDEFGSGEALRALVLEPAASARDRRHPRRRPLLRRAARRAAGRDRRLGRASPVGRRRPLLDSARRGVDSPLQFSPRPGRAVTRAARARGGVSLATSGSLASSRRAEQAFFGGMSALIAVTILLGFARTYYLRPLVGAPSPPLPSLTPLIHVHGLLFTGWIVLLVAQTRLVAAGRVDVHRRLGIAGAALAVLMIGVGTLTALHGVVRGVSPGGIEPRRFLAMPLFALVVFGCCSSRGHPRAARPAVAQAAGAPGDDRSAAPGPRAVGDRLPRPGPALRPRGLSSLFVLPLVAWDWMTLRRLHPATLWGGLLVVGSGPLRLAIAFTPAWLAFADWAVAPEAVGLLSPSGRGSTTGLRPAPRGRPSPTRGRAAGSARAPTRGAPRSRAAGARRRPRATTARRGRRPRGSARCSARRPCAPPTRTPRRRAAARGAGRAAVGAM